MLVLRDGKYVRKTLKTFRIHDEWGASKDWGRSFTGEIFIEEDADGINLDMFKQALEPSRKNEGATKVAFAAVYSAGMILIGFAIRNLMLVHWLR